MYYILISTLIVGAGFILVRSRKIALLYFELRLLNQQKTCDALTRSINIVALGNLQKRLQKLLLMLYRFEQRRIAEGYVCPTKKEILVKNSWAWTKNDQAAFVALSNQAAELDRRLTELLQPLEVVVRKNRNTTS